MNPSPELKIFLDDQYYHIYRIDERQDENIFYVKSKKHTAVCPKCGQKTDYLHSTSKRTLQDEPIRGKKTTIKIEPGVYCCLNPDCDKRTFVEEVSFANKYARRTHSLDAHILAVSLSSSYNQARQTLSGENVTIGNGAIKRIFENVDLCEESEPVVIGIDDVASKKGHSYYTVIYNLMTGGFLELLDGREAEALIDWLKEHPGIEFAARDRFKNYKIALDTALPQCVQVVDRFHLIKNITDKVEASIKEAFLSRLYVVEGKVFTQPPAKKSTALVPLDAAGQKRLESLFYDDTAPRDRNGRIIDFDDTTTNIESEQARQGAQKRRQKQQKIQDLQAYRSQNPKLPGKELAEIFDISQSTVYKYLKMSEEDIRKIGLPKKDRAKASPLRKYANIIYKMLADGFSILEVAHYVSSLDGFDLDLTQLINYVFVLEQKNFGSTMNFYDARDLLEDTYGPNVQVISRKKLLSFVTDRSKKPRNNELRRLLYKTFPVLKQLRAAYLRFYKAIMKNDGDLEKLIEDSKDGVLGKFFKELKKDLEAVKNAMVYELNSGVVEGMNNKFKMIKRIFFGRSSRENLKKRCQLLFCQFSEAFCFIDLVKNPPKYAYFL